MSPRALTIAAALCALAGCTKDRTEAVVVISTAGVRIPDDVDTIDVQIADTADLANPVFMKRFRVCGGDVADNCLALPLDLTLIPGAHIDHSSRVQVTASRNDTDVIDDAAVFTFAAGQSLRLDFVLYANCLGNTDCALRDQACGPDAMCQPVPVVPISGDPDLGVGPGGGGGDLATGGGPEDMSMPGAGDLAGADMAQPIDDMAQPIMDMVVPPDFTGCIPLCPVGSCGLSNCGTPCMCAANEVCASDKTCQPAPDGGSSGTPDKVLTWTKASFDSGIFNGVWGLSGGSVWAVGNYVGGGSVVWVNTNPAANPLAFVADTSNTSMSALSAISGRALNDVYAVGPSGAVVHYDGSSWSDAGAGLGSSLGVHGVWVGGPNDDVWAVAGNVMSPGNDGYGYSHHNTALFPSGTHWSATTGTGHAYQAVWGDGSGFVMMVADESRVSYSPNNGGFLNAALGTTNNTLYGVFGFSPMQMWAVGDGGAIWHMSYKTSTMLFGSSQETNLVPTTTAAFYAIGGTANNLWVVGDSNSVYHSTGDGTWTRQTNLPTPDNFTAFRGVLALGANDVYIVGGIQSSKVILHGK